MSKIHSMPASRTAAGPRFDRQLAGATTERQVSAGFSPDWQGQNMSCARGGHERNLAPERIAIFLQDLAGGGAERIMLRLAGGFSAKGKSVDLVLVRAEGPYLADLPTGVRLVDLNCRRTLRGIGRLRSYLRDQRPTVLLSALVHVNVAA